MIIRISIWSSPTTNGNVEVEFIDNSREEPYEIRSYFVCNFGDEKMVPGIMLMHETILEFVKGE